MAATPRQPCAARGLNLASLSSDEADIAAGEMLVFDRLPRREVDGTPEGYGFDFVVVLASPTARLELDGAELGERCEVSPADGLEHDPGDDTALVYRCPISWPTLVPPVGGGGAWTLEDGVQADGPHELEASEPVGLLLFVFDSFTYFALPGGISLRPLE